MSGSRHKGARTILSMHIIIKYGTRLSLLLVCKSRVILAVPDFSLKGSSYTRQTSFLRGAPYPTNPSSGVAPSQVQLAIVADPALQPLQTVSSDATSLISQLQHHSSHG